MGILLSPRTSRKWNKKFVVCNKLIWEVLSLIAKQIKKIFYALDISIISWCSCSQLRAQNGPHQKNALCKSKMEAWQHLQIFRESLVIHNANSVNQHWRCADLGPLLALLQWENRTSVHTRYSPRCGFCQT